jgi:hypothetical protein
MKSQHRPKSSRFGSVDLSPPKGRSSTIYLPYNTEKPNSHSPQKKGSPERLTSSDGNRRVLRNSSHIFSQNDIQYLRKGSKLGEVKDLSSRMEEIKLRELKAHKSDLQLKLKLRSPDDDDDDDDNKPLTVVKRTSRIPRGSRRTSPVKRKPIRLLSRSIGSSDISSNEADGCCSSSSTYNIPNFIKTEEDYIFNNLNEMAKIKRNRKKSHFEKIPKKSQAQYFSGFYNLGNTVR